MKKIIQVALVVFALTGTGCSDSFFDKKPQGSLDPSKIDERLITSYRDAVYRYVGVPLSGYDAVFLDGYADNGYSRNSWDSNGSAVQSNTLSADLDFGYETCYAGIRACNKLIHEIDQYPSVESVMREKYKNEARVMRAWLYTSLTLYFGDVPLITSPQNDYPEGLSRTSAKEIREWVLKELDEAFSILPEANEKGRFNKAMTSAIKARAAYYFGNYAEAEKAARYVIEKGGYKLHEVSALSTDMQKDAEFFKQLVDFNASGINETSFIKGLFNYQNIWRADNSPETIVAKEYLPTEENGSWVRVTAFMSPNMVNKQAWATIVPIQELVDAYWMVDGKTKPNLPSMEQRINDYKEMSAEVQKQISAEVSFSKAVHAMTGSLVKKPYMNQFRNRDSRLYASIVFPFSSISRFRMDEYQQYIPDIVNYGRSGFTFRKMTGVENVISAWGDAYYITGVDFPVIRLAEMLLVYAEAHTQTTGYDESVTAELNKLRIRAGMPVVPNSLSKNEALDFIRAERRIELAGEGLRFLDIRLYEDNQRNGGYKGAEAASTVMKGQIRDVVGNPGTQLTWAPRLMYMPLPTTALDKNKSKEMKQNEGY